MAANNGKEEGEGQGQELTLEQLLYIFVKDIDKQVAKADEELEKLCFAADEIRFMVYKPLEPGEIPLELEFHDIFRSRIDALHAGVGITIDYVIRLEKSRKRLERYLPREEIEAVAEEKTSPATPAAPISVMVTQPQQSQPVHYRGYFASRAEIKKAEIWAQIEREKMERHSVVTTKEILDVVEFGRQLLPAFNKVKMWIPCALAIVRQFQNDHVYFNLHQEVAKFLSQTLGSLVSFVGACVEYRKTLLQGRKLGMARNIARIAEAASYGPKITPGGAFSPGGFKLDRSGFQER